MCPSFLLPHISFPLPPFPPALGARLQYHAAEEPQHGGWTEEETGDEATTGRSCGSQENLLCQLHGHL